MPSNSQAKPIQCVDNVKRWGVPFMAESKLSVSGPRVTEALIIALVTSIVGYIMTVPRLQTRLDQVEESVKGLKSDLQYEMRGVKTEMGELRKDLYVPVGGRYEPAPTSDPAR